MVAMMKGDTQITQYLPDEYFEKKVPHREFFFNILNTVYPEYVTEILNHAHKQRTNLDAERQQE